MIPFQASSQSDDPPLTCSMCRQAVDAILPLAPSSSGAARHLAGVGTGFKQRIERIRECIMAPPSKQASPYLEALADFEKTCRQQFAPSESDTFQGSLTPTELLTSLRVKGQSMLLGIVA